MPGKVQFSSKNATEHPSFRLIADCLMKLFNQIMSLKVMCSDLPFERLVMEVKVIRVC